MARPSSTATAAGVGGVLAGVPIGMYAGTLIMGLLAAFAPDFLETLRSVEELDLVKSFQTAISGIITALVAFLFSWKKKEVVYKMSPRDE